MRIRKNAQLASRGYLPGSGFQNRQVHLCQLNQSRWDAMSFGAEPEETRPDPYYPPPLQFDGDNSYPGNGSLGDSIGAIESAASMIDSEGNALIDTGVSSVIDYVIDNVSENNQNEEVKFSLEDTTRHSRIKNGKRIPEKQARLSRRGRPRTAKRGGASAPAAPASNPYEFYYYSGFGPLWGKRRGEKGVGGEVNNNTNKKDCDDENRVATRYSSSSSSSSESDSDRADDNVGLDFIDDDDDDDEFENDGRKRMRKPVKARSLKSLM